MKLLQMSEANGMEKERRLAVGRAAEPKRAAAKTGEKNRMKATHKCVHSLAVP